MKREHIMFAVFECSTDGLHKINIQYGTCEDLIARHKLYTYSRTLARRYNTISVTHPLYF